MTRPVLLLLAAIAAYPQDTANVNRGSAILKTFADRIAEYVKLHKAAQSEVQKLKPTNSAEAIQDYERRLAERIRATRRDAAQGSVFTPDIAQEFRRLIGMTMHGPEAVRIRESLKRAAPVGKLALHVNDSYPSQLPLQSAPPSLLLNLPPLPPEVEYRVVGHDLLIRDIDANLIVDFILNVIA